MENNKTIPKIRFTGFTDAWEQRKLGNLTQIKTGSSDLQDSVEDGQYPFFVRSENIERSNRYIFDGEAILIPGEGRLGDIYHYINGKFDFHQRVYKISGFEDSNTDGKYILYYMQKNFKQHAMRFTVKATVDSLRLPMLTDFDVVVPKIEEQRKISNLFANLDSLITLHQRECDLLVKTKKSYLQKMFPKNGEDKPEIRFAGFTDAWEQRRLGDIAERVTRKNKDLESTLPLTISAQDGLIDQNEFFNKTVASRDVSGYYLMKNGEFAYNKSYSNGYPWGAVKRLDRYDMGVLSTLYIIFKPTKVNSTFLAKYYDTDNWYKEVSKHAAEGARNHGLLNIAASDFFETELLIPSNIEEQSKIGDFFTQLDHLITLHQRELNSLKNMKKSLLQQMFI